MLTHSNGILDKCIKMTYIEINCSIFGYCFNVSTRKFTLHMWLILYCLWTVLLYYQ